MDYLYLIAGALAILLLTVFMRKGRSSGPSVVVLGPQGSGKTFLFHQVKHTQLQSGKEVKTVSSLKPNSALLSTPKPFTLWDVPGHSYFRENLIKEASQAVGAILIVDANDRSSFKAAAEQLYDLFATRKPKEILIFCNKQDLPMAKKSLMVESEISTEMYLLCSERLKRSKDMGEEASVVGRPDERFEFSHMADHGVQVKLAEGSLLQNDYAVVREFLAKILQ